MNHRPDFDKYDDIDRLFQLTEQDDPAPGKVFDETLGSLRGWHASSLASVKNAVLLKVGSTLGLMAVGGLIISVITLGLLTANHTISTVDKNTPTLVVAPAVAEKENAPNPKETDPKLVAARLRTFGEILENNNSKTASYEVAPAPTASRLSEPTLPTRNLYLDRQLKLEMTMNSSPRPISTRENLTEDAKPPVRHSNNMF